MELRLKVGARGRGGEKRTREEEEKAGKTTEVKGEALWVSLCLKLHISWSVRQRVESRTW